MSQNKVWIAILALVGAIALWFCAKALYQVYDYVRFDSQTVAEVESWSVEQVGSDRFALRAVYGFQVGEELYEGESYVPKLVFLNALAAKRRIEELESGGWAVWYRSRNPALSRLGKVFPYKQCAYALILLGVMVYFIFLGRMAGRADRYVDP
jgi:hypothetical protein